MQFKFYIMYETERAFQVTPDRKAVFWLPKTQVKRVSQPVKEGSSLPTWLFEVPEWLVKKNSGLKKYQVGKFSHWESPNRTPSYSKFSWKASQAT